MNKKVVVKRMFYCWKKSLFCAFAKSAKKAQECAKQAECATETANLLASQVGELASCT